MTSCKGSIILLYGFRSRDMTIISLKLKMLRLRKPQREKMFYIIKAHGQKMPHRWYNAGAVCDFGMGLLFLAQFFLGGGDF